MLMSAIYKRGDLCRCLIEISKTSQAQCSVDRSSNHDGRTQFHIEIHVGAKLLRSFQIGASFRKPTTKDSVMPSMT